MSTPKSDIITNMFESVSELIGNWFDRGGWVMWPLSALSLVGVALIFERCWFWMSTAGAWRKHRYAWLAQRMRGGSWEEADAAAQSDASIYGRILRRVVEERGRSAAGQQAIEEQRHRMERFMPTLSTIITAAPMLGILGTVTGIIDVANVFEADAAVTDPAQVLPGIGEALLTTVVGLVIAVIVLFPYNVFRTQIDRAVGRMETLVNAGS